MSAAHDRFELAQRHIPGGVNSPVRAFKGVGGDPVFVESAAGAYFFDPDGKRNCEKRGESGYERISWDEAALFCNWLSDQESLPKAYEQAGGSMVAVVPPTSGYRLPTEAEWAWAARYPDGATPIKYPWGDSLPVLPDSGNYADAGAADLLPKTLSGYNDDYPVTAPVDSFDPSPLGLFNLGGNVAEWMHDYYTVYPGESDKLVTDPLGPVSGEHHVVRDSSWRLGTITELRLSYRDYSRAARPDLGFRVARYAE